jgi:hypothetical protein
MGMKIVPPRINNLQAKKLVFSTVFLPERFPEASATGAHPPREIVVQF